MFTYFLVGSFLPHPLYHVDPMQATVTELKLQPSLKYNSWFSGEVLLVPLKGFNFRWHLSNMSTWAEGRRQTAGKCEFFVWTQKVYKEMDMDPIT